MVNNVSGKQQFSPKEWILALLYAGGGKIKGKTRIQKGIFLINREIETVETPEFFPYDYGPYSPELDEALRELKEEGLVIIRKVPGGDEAPATLVELTDKGRMEAEKVWKRLQENREFPRIKLRLEFAAKTPLTLLLAYVYGAYHDYIRNSKIKRKVKNWQTMWWF